MHFSEIESIVNNLTGFSPVPDVITPLAEAELREIEKRVSGVLPDAFKLFTSYGAGSFNDKVVVPYIRQVPKSVTSKKVVRLGVFLGSNTAEGINILEALETLGSRFPKKTVPFNFTFANYFILDVEDSENYGKIYYFVTSEDIDDEEFYETNNREITRAEKLANCYLLANSFEEFLRKLTIDPKQ